MAIDLLYKIFKHKLQNYNNKTAWYTKIQSMKHKVRNYLYLKLVKVKGGMLIQWEKYKCLARYLVGKDTWLYLFQ